MVMIIAALEISADTRIYIEENEIGWLNICAPGYDYGYFDRVCI